MREKLSKMDRPLLISTIILFIFGIIMIFSASSMESYMRYNYSPYHYFIRELIFLAIGCGCSCFVIFLPTQKYRKFDKILLAIAIISLAGLLVYGYAANNAASWYKFGPFTLQPSEFAKIIVIKLF